MSTNWGAYAKEYSKLVGYTVTDIAVDKNTFPDNELCGLILTKEGKHKQIAWILRDPEGNGIGFLELQSQEDLTGNKKEDQETIKMMKTFIDRLENS